MRRCGDAYRFHQDGFQMNVLLLHPGEMGSSIGAALAAAGHDVAWLPAGRSAATAERATKAQLREAASLTAGLATAELAVSVCPPHAAAVLAADVHAAGFHGVFLDANAVAPTTAASIEALFGERYVDGGIVGPPAWRAGATRLYLAGPRAQTVAALFAGSLVDARVLNGGSPAASALKMCYAAYTKGSSALLLGVRALASQHGVTDALLREWAVSQPGLADRSASAARSTAPKAWRFAGEMAEIAAAFAAAGLPDGFHAAAAELYVRLAPLRDLPGEADLEAAVRAILKEHSSHGPRMA